MYREHVPTTCSRWNCTENKCERPDDRPGDDNNRIKIHGCNEAVIEIQSQYFLWLYIYAIMWSRWCVLFHTTYRPRITSQSPLGLALSWAPSLAFPSPFVNSSTAGGHRPFIPFVVKKHSQQKMILVFFRCITLNCLHMISKPGTSQALFCFPWEIWSSYSPLVCRTHE